MTDLQNEWAMTPLHAVVLRLAETDPEGPFDDCKHCDGSKHFPSSIEDETEPYLIHKPDCLWLEARRLVDGE